MVVMLPLSALAGLAAVGSFLFFIAYRHVTYAISARKYARSHGTKPPKTLRHWDPFLGLDFVWNTVRTSRGKYQLADLQHRFNTIGHTFESNVLSDFLIFTDEPKNAQAVLATNFADYDMGELRRQATVKLLGHGIFNADGAYWAHSRALIRPNFVRQQVADLDMMERHVQHMISYLPGDGTPVDIQSYFFRMTMDTATEFLFGRSINSLNPDATQESKRFSWAFDYALGCIALKIRFGRFNWFYNRSRYTEACNYLHNYVKPIIADALDFRESKNYKGHDASLVSSAATAMEKSKGTKSVTAEMMFANKNNSHSDESMNDEKPKEDQTRYVFLHEVAKHTGNPNELRDQVINTLIAGRDTTASLLSSALFMLARSPAVWKTLQREVHDTLPDSAVGPTFEQLKDMKYVRYVLHETLRLFPVVPVNAKFANKDTVLPRGGGPGGNDPLFVKKGQMVIWVIYSMHRREDLWGSDAAVFKPERWEGAQPGFKFLPFNGGPRICPGQQFALTEASYAIVRLCQAFSRIEVVDEAEAKKPWVESLNLTCAVTGGVNVRCFK